ncbi:MAG: glycosyltransferase family A protein [Dermatophilaceae bacterium]
MESLLHVVVAVPVRDEETLLASCLRSLVLAQDELRAMSAGVQTDIVVALDSCTDGSAAVAGTFPVAVVTTNQGCVGGARDTAIEVGVAGCRSLGIPLARTWLACTDADTRVPPNWLTRQVALGDDGADLVLGTVEPSGQLDSGLLARWRAGHQLVEDHPHIHGANLGLRASTWFSLDGFGHLPAHEDRQLAHRARASGAICVATDSMRVRTSSRLAGRVTGGFADHLAALTKVSGSGWGDLSRTAALAHGVDS